MRRVILFIAAITLLIGWIGQAQATKFTAKFVDQELSLDPHAAIWTQTQSVTIKLNPQQIASPFGGGAVQELQARALHNGRQIAFLLEWVDITRDMEATQSDQFSDAVALQFPVDLGSNPGPFMGDAKHTVNIWQWQAAWQRDIDEGGLADVDRVYPAYADTIPYGVAPGRDAGNWRAQRTRSTPVENMVALGYNTLTHQEQQPVLGRGVWANGRWKVVLVRALQTGLAGDATFASAQKLSVNFAAWDGASAERGARKAVSLAWHELQLEAPVAGAAAPAKPAPQEVVRVVGVPGWLTAVIAALALLFGALIMWVIRRPRSHEPEIG